MPKDYVGGSWSKKSFLDVLQGKRPYGGSGKTLKTKANDRIFIYFESHGDAGLSLFGRSWAEYITSTELNNVILPLYFVNIYSF